ncbi:MULTISPECIES: TIGR00341 family protein [unclassified Haladaptatus]|uniref:TIGR00341 family protein n=1 Tax=unclassified Haladaptatus TaxID=2622732 RepID=UPI0023E78E71|nr:MULTISPECIES: TIGR00341 family protein [unclassified Haladaptatus]
MRLVQVFVPDGHRTSVEEILDDENIDSISTAEEGTGEGVIFHFPLPPQAVEHVLDRLEEAGLDRDNYTVVLNAETVHTPRFGELENRYVEGTEENDRIASEEIRTKARNMHPNPVTYYAMTLLSAFVATAGLLLNSPAIVVGSMVIAPQVGSALTASVGGVLNDRKMLWQGLRAQSYGLALAIVGAAVFGWLLKTAAFIPTTLDVSTVDQISRRISPGFLSLAVGICAGAAGAFGLATALPASLVGVMIAAALIPAAAAVGIGVAWGYPTVAAGAFVLLVMNAAAINLAGFSVLRYLGYKSGRVDNDGHSGPSLGAIAAVLIVVGSLGAAGAVTSQQVSFENTVNSEVEDILSQPAYDELELVRVDTSIADEGVFTDEQRVSVVVRRPPDRSYPSLAPTIADAVKGHTDQKIVVEITYVEQERYRQ